MLARLRARLTYANVVATLALFVALGGTGYAASQITSRDVKNRSLKGGDLKKDTVTGSEIRESRLGRVPLAETSVNATNADIAKTAGSATTAAAADVANDAKSLAGQGVGAFERSTRVQFGSAGASPAGPANEQALFSWPEMGVAITSSSTGCGAGQARIAVSNTKSSGPAAEAIADGSAGAIVTADPGEVERFCGDSNNGDVSGVVFDSTGRALFFDCIQATAQLRCLGLRSQP
jgi:hypothetical protein